jgi:foldase protein PrsA
MVKKSKSGGVKGFNSGVVVALRRLEVLLFFVFVLLTLSGQLNCLYAQLEGERVLVTVDGQPITQNDLYQAIIESFPQQSQQILNRLINEVLILKEAEKRKIKVSEDEIKKEAEELGIVDSLSPTIKRMIETSILLEKMIADENKIQVSDDEIKSFYEKNKDQLGEPEQVHIRQIFVLSEREANDILIALNAGADFAKMAAIKSQDAASRERGGDLGFFARGMLAEQIEKVAFDMEVGQIGPVIKTAAGFHIIKVEEKKPEKEAKYDKETRKRIKRLLFKGKVQEVLPGWLDNLRKEADIK